MNTIPLRFFKCVDEDNKPWVNWCNTQEDADYHIKSGFEELPADLIIAEFGDEVYNFCKETTYFDSDGAMVYDPPQSFIQLDEDMKRQNAKHEAAHELSKLSDAVSSIERMATLIHKMKRK